MEKDDRIEMLVCLDSASPYSFFALVVLLRYQERWNLNLKLLPVLLGAVHAATGNKPPSIMVPAKGQWLVEDMQRNARFMDVPIRGVPANFGTTLNSLQCQRVLTAIAESKGYDSKELAAAFLAFFRGIFGGEPNRDLNISDSKFLLKCCMAAGFTEAESEQYISSSKDEIIKLRLKENTALAVEKGMFGAPTIYVTPREKNLQGVRQPRDLMFFGSDRFEQLAFSFGKL